MSARTRRATGSRDLSSILLQWQQASELRAEWLRYGLCCAPAQRDAAEAAIRGLYALVPAASPRFVWVDSPGAAIARLSGPTDAIIDLSSDRWTRDGPPFVALLAESQAKLRRSLERTTRSSLNPAWIRGGSSALARDQPEEALRRRVPLGDVLDVGVLDSLRLSLRDGLSVPLRGRLGAAANSIAWHGQHDAHWVAHFDVRHRIGFGRIDRHDAAHLELWATLVRACGWWWPFRDVCLLTERMSAVSTEPMPGSSHGEVRPHNADGAAVLYPDGWGLHAWHGTPVPAWVIDDPSVERIRTERNIEVRRCAIERIGWQRYVEQAQMRLVAEAPDPGNPGYQLRLFELPPDPWESPGRVLLAVNGSVERDGRRRRYGLNVPADIDDPVTAAGWSYGLSGPQYAQLQRRT
jgi:hypothetical protein